MSCYRCGKSVTAQDRKYGLHKACFSTWFGVEHSAEFENIIPHSAGSNKPPSEEKWSGVASSFFQGKFKKYSARLGDKNYLLKIQEQEYPELPQTEYLCNQLAEALRIEIPNYFLITFEEIPAFVCENFMQKEVSSNLVHIYHYLNEPRDYTCEELYEIVIEKTQKISEAQRIIDITLFDSLIGNHDRHGRNLGLIQSGKGFRLSPFYDNPSYLGIEIEALLSAQLEPRGKIATKITEDPSIKDYVLEWGRLGQREYIKKIFRKIDINVLVNIIENSYLKNNRKAAFKKLILKRYEELSHAITE